MWIGCPNDDDLLDGAAPTLKRPSTWCEVSWKSRPPLAAVRSSSPFLLTGPLLLLTTPGAGQVTSSSASQSMALMTRTQQQMSGHAFELRFPSVHVTSMALSCWPSVRCRVGRQHLTRRVSTSANCSYKRSSVPTSCPSLSVTRKCEGLCVSADRRAIAVIGALVRKPYFSTGYVDFSVSECDDNLDNMRYCSGVSCLSRLPATWSASRARPRWGASVV